MRGKLGADGQNGIWVSVMLECACVCVPAHMYAGPQMSERSQGGEKKIPAFIKYICPHSLCN